MKQRVTNEQIDAILICHKYDWCEGCPKYEAGCPLKGKSVNFDKEIATNLLEARARLDIAVKALEYVQSLASKVGENFGELVYVDFDIICDALKEIQQ